MLIYFFQAEDGIRDGHVTGVQTCALPISEADRGGVDHRSETGPAQELHLRARALRVVQFITWQQRAHLENVLVAVDRPEPFRRDLTEHGAHGLHVRAASAASLSRATVCGVISMSNTSPITCDQPWMKYRQPSSMTSSRSCCWARACSRNSRLPR